MRLYLDKQQQQLADSDNNYSDKNEVIEEKWMLIIRRYPNGQSYPLKFFKLGHDSRKPKHKLKQSKQQEDNKTFIKEVQEEVI